MPALIETAQIATVEWLGAVPADIAEDRVNSEPARALDLDLGGVVGDHHYGQTRPACVRVKHLYARGTPIRNTRQLSIVSKEELDAIASEIGLSELNPCWLGATMVVSGIPDFTHVPPSSRLQAASGLTLVVDMENRPCVWPGREIERDHPGLGPKFKPAAANRRGVTAWVEHPGTVEIGDRFRLFVPDQPAWQESLGQS